LFITNLNVAPGEKVKYISMRPKVARLKAYPSIGPDNQNWRAFREFASIFPEPLGRYLRRRVRRICVNFVG